MNRPTYSPRIAPLAHVTSSVEAESSLTSQAPHVQRQTHRDGIHRVSDTTDSHLSEDISDGQHGPGGVEADPSLVNHIASAGRLSQYVPPSI